MATLATTIDAMLADATAAGISMAIIGITLGVIALVRRKA